jgi:hypothetical protein
MTALPIVIPSGFDPIITVGQTILVGEPLAKARPQTDAKINIAKELKVPLKKMKNVLKKNPGDAIEKDDILAHKKSFFGVKELILRSKLSGTVLRYERTTGNLVIRIDDENALGVQTLISPVEGNVSVCNNEQIVIQTDKHTVSGKQGVGEIGEGEVFVLEKSLDISELPEESNMLYFLDNHAIGKVIVGGSLTKDVLMKGIGMGAVGLIGTDIAEEDLAYIEEKQLKTPVISIEKDMLDAFLQWKGKKVFVDGASKSVIFLQL